MSIGLIDVDGVVGKRDRAVSHRRDKETFSGGGMTW